MEHILKRTYIDMPDCYRSWVESVDKQRIGLRCLLKDSPSLKPYFSEVFDEVYADVLMVICRSYPQCRFPEKWPFERNTEALLSPSGRVKTLAFRRRLQQVRGVVLKQESERVSAWSAYDLRDSPSPSSQSSLI